MERQKVYVFSTAYLPFVGGAEIAIQEVSRRLKNRFDFTIVTARMRRGLPKREVRPEGTVIRLGFGINFDKWLLPLFVLFRISDFGFRISNLGMGMMTKAIVWAKDSGKKYIYLGSFQRPTDTYKLQFSGLEWFDGRVWKNDLDELKNTYV